MQRAGLVPRPCLMRLPHYYRRLLQAMHEQQAIISSQELGSEAGVPAALVRRDLSYLGEIGHSGIGYNVRELATRLEDFLGLKETKEAVLVGVGNLGRALAAYPGFARYGLRITGLFDSDPAKIGSRVGGTEVRSLNELEGFIRERGIALGILAVPAPPAQAIAERMAGAGVRVIWNFAPTGLRLPPHVLVFNEDLAARLATLSYYISHAVKPGEESA